MAEITMEEILKKRGLEDRIQDSRLTRAIAAELKKKGYRRLTKREGGKLVRVWSNEVDQRISDREDLARELVEGL